MDGGLFVEIGRASAVGQNLSGADQRKVRHGLIIEHDAEVVPGPQPLPQDRVAISACSTVCLHIAGGVGGDLLHVAVDDHPHGLAGGGSLAADVNVDHRAGELAVPVAPDGEERPVFRLGPVFFKSLDRINVPVT